MSGHNIDFLKSEGFCNGQLCTYLVSFKVTLLRCNTLMPAFFSILIKFCSKELFGIANSSRFDFNFIFSIVAKRFPFIGVFSFGKTKFWWMRVCFWHALMCRLMRYHGVKPMTAFSQFCALLTNFFVQSVRNFKVLLIKRTTLWQEFIMHHAIASKKTVSKSFTFEHRH